MRLSLKIKSGISKLGIDLLELKLLRIAIVFTSFLCYDFANKYFVMAIDTFLYAISFCSHY